jgi:RecG-like helicase
MKNKKELVFIILGAVLILGALLLYLYNGYEDNEAGQQAEVVASEIISVIENKEVIQIKPEEPMEEERTELEVVMIDGYEYIGHLKIDALGLNLPILSNWSNNGLKIAEEDLKLRGSGTLYGTKQHGVSEIFSEVGFTVGGFGKAKEIWALLDEQKQNTLKKEAIDKYRDLYEKIIIN